MNIEEKYAISDFDVAEYLNDDESIALYLEQVLLENDEHAFVQALKDVARAKGMSEIAKKSGISRESLYQSLSSQKPRFETIRKILNGLNLELVPRVRRSSTH